MFWFKYPCSQGRVRTDVLNSFIKIVFQHPIQPYSNRNYSQLIEKLQKKHICFIYKRAYNYILRNLQCKCIPDIGVVKRFFVEIHLVGKKTPIVSAQCVNYTVLTSFFVYIDPRVLQSVLFIVLLKQNIHVQWGGTLYQNSLKIVYLDAAFWQVCHLMLHRSVELDGNERHKQRYVHERFIY